MKLPRYRSGRPRCRPEWTPAQRLANYTKVDPATGCHIWQASTNKAGYGQLILDRRMISAHRLAWVVKHGPIREGLEVCHRCDVRLCCNPDHMFLGTHAENMADIKAKNRRRWRIPMERLPTDHSALDAAPIEIFIGGLRFVGHAQVRPFQPHRTGARRSRAARRR
jgi:hypothetical protein